MVETNGHLGPDASVASAADTTAPGAAQAALVQPVASTTTVA